MYKLCFLCFVVLCNPLFFNCFGQHKGVQLPSAINIQNPQIGQVNIVLGIYSSEGSGRFRPDSYKVLDSLSEVIKAMTNCVFQIEMHTDCRADSTYNIIISQRFVDSAVAYIERKINSKRVIALGMGEREPLNNCICEGDQVVFCTEEEHQQNRRMQIRIIGRVAK